jgi:flagellar biosynthesis GTPase FlhF
MEKNILRVMEIRCPYCRHIQRKLLPYYEDMGVQKVHGVNFYDESLFKNKDSNCSQIIGNCCYQVDGIKCSHTLVYVVECLEGNMYCIYHKFKAIQELEKKKKLDAKKKAKEEKEEAKKKEKEAKEEAKKKEKEANKESKKKEKEANKESKKKEKEADAILCKQILKSGKNAGKECCCKVYKNENMCLRHWNLSK